MLAISQDGAIGGAICQESRVNKGIWEEWAASSVHKSRTELESKLKLDILKVHPKDVTPVLFLTIIYPLLLI